MDIQSLASQTNHFDANSVYSYRLESKYDGYAKTYDEYPPGQAVEKWTVGELLGRGGFSVVHKHVQEGTGRVRAVKTIEKSRYEFHAREFNIMAVLNKSEHRFLFVELLGWFENDDRLFIAMEYFERGDLGKHLDKPLPEGVVQKITKQVLNGLQVMHGNKIAHQDLKPENIFVVSMSPVWVKLGDFGISKRVHGDTAFRSRVYTDYYAAPEFLGLDTNAKSSDYTIAVDIWALGCVVYELLTGQKLFGTLGQTTNYYYKEAFPEQKLNKLTTPTSDAVKSFIRRLVVLNSEERPSAVNAASDVWLKYVEDGPAQSRVGVSMAGLHPLHHGPQTPLSGPTFGARETCHNPSAISLSSNVGPGGDNTGDMEYTLTNHLESDLAEPFRLNTEYDGNCSSYNEHRPGHETEKWTVGEVLGSGGFSVVHKHVLEGTGRVRAVKTIEKSVYPFHARELNIMAILSKFEHRSLFVELLGWFENNDRLFIAMEYLEQGDLRKHLDKPLAEEVVQKITKQVLSGLQVMHENNIAHRCIKPEDIYVVSMSPVWVKLGDFGISKRVHGDTALRSQVYTACYAAPEVIGLDTDAESSVYTNAVDIWALGCVVYELLTGRKLFITLGQITNYYYNKAFLDRKLSKLTTPTSDAVKSFIRRLMVLDSNGRPSAAEAAGDVWLEDVEDCPELSRFNIQLTELRTPQNDQRFSPSSLIN